MNQGTVEGVRQLPDYEWTDLCRSKEYGVLGKTLNSSVVVLSTTLNSCGAIEEMIL